MNRFLFRLFPVAIAVAVVVAATPRTTSAAEPVRILFETDISPDCDDAGAAAVLHALADLGEAEILAMGVNSSFPYGAPTLDAINTYYGRPNIPVGAWRGAEIMHWSRYSLYIAQHFPNSIYHNHYTPDPAKLYQDILKEQPDNSVVIVSVGALNNLYNLLKADRELVARKVKELVVMGGRFPPESNEKPEFNFKEGVQRGELPPATVTVVSEWPTPIMFSGHEIGAAIETGAGLVDLPKTNPVREAYMRYVGPGKVRASYDQTAVLYAVRGLGDYWTSVDEGHLHAFPNGRNEWRDSPDRDHAYLVQKMPPEQVARVIDELMTQPPKNASQGSVEDR